MKTGIATTFLILIVFLGHSQSSLAVNKCWGGRQIQMLDPEQASIANGKGHSNIDLVFIIHEGGIQFRDKTYTKAYQLNNLVEEIRTEKKESVVIGILENSQAVYFTELGCALAIYRDIREVGVYFIEPSF